MNLTQKRAEMKRVPRMAMAGACLAIGAVTCGSALALRLEVTAPFMQTDGGSGSAGSQSAHAPARVSGGVMAGQVLTRVNPVYPQDAKDAKIQGAVVLRAIIGRDGLVENLQVISGPEKLRGASLDAVRQWTYKPYLLNGDAVQVQTTITVNYSLAN